MKRNLIVALLLFGLPLFLNAAKVDDLKSEIKKRADEIKFIEAEIASYQKQIDASESESRTLKNEITKLESVLKKLNLEIKLTEGKIHGAELNLEKLDIEISDKNISIEQRRESLGEIIKSINQSDDVSFLEMILKSEKVSDFFFDVKSREELGRSINENLSALKLLKDELENKKAEESSIIISLAEFKNELSDKKMVQESNKGVKNVLLKETKNKEALYQKLLSERETKRKQILEEIMKIEDELKKMIDVPTLPDSRPGILSWPVLNVKVTQGYGKTDFARNTDVYGQRSHNGIDLRAAVGTPIMAAEDGVVRGIGNADLYCPGGSYGKWVLVEHPNKLSTLYAHLSYIKVTNGQNIKRGEVIAYSGDTGYTTGPHLHFTVYDARTVYIKASRVCGLLPYGGYLNPLLYL
ncbi:peptidoglycan DD-metalloendopeptidase family protein [Candidatus Giovannonibacteria bacterium]|nr:peptidoglycan DD-metalloendopeptidase family protein [Candidatus Giovannonibacteria bacterium]